MFSFLLILLAGHVFVDYFLQLTRFATYKRKCILVLIAHALTWAFVLSLILIFISLFSPWKFYFLFATHFIIDWLKIRFFKAALSKLHPVNVTDQLMHLVTILVVLYYAR